MKKKFTKIIAMVLTVTMMFSVAIPVFANEPVIVNEIPETVVSYLSDEDGNVITIEGVMVERPIALAADEYAVTYLYALPKSALTTGHTTLEGEDNSISVQAELTIHFTTKNDPTEYLLTQVQGSWSLLDSSVTVLGNSVAYHCIGLLPVPTKQTKTYRNVRNSFGYYTGFTNYVSSVDGGLVGAQIDFELQHGSSTWDWSLPNYVIDAT